MTMTNYTASLTELQTSEVDAPRNRGVYLLHFHSPISASHTTQHYLGYADNIASRVETHQAGNSKAARLTQVAVEKGIPFSLARVWNEKNRDFERKLKNRKNAPKLCPYCNPNASNNAS
jgi:predicted GIY-YIG superfamily endonuclease